LLECIRKASVGDPLLTEKELCKRFGISRPTVRQAINELVVEGYLRKKKGEGAIVAGYPDAHDSLLIQESLSEDMARRGIVPETRIMKFESTEPHGVVSAALNLPPDSQAVYVFRVRLVDSVPIVVSESYLPLNSFPGILEKNLENISLYRILKLDYGVTIDKYSRTIEYAGANEQVAANLGISAGDATQRIETIAYTNSDVPIEYSIASYRADRVRFKFHLTSGSFVITYNP
jgi:GntR family transcriptional regulator